MTEQIDFSGQMDRILRQYCEEYEGFARENPFNDRWFYKATQRLYGPVNFRDCQQRFSREEYGRQVAPFKEELDALTDQARVQAIDACKEYLDSFVDLWIYEGAIYGVKNFGELPELVSGDFINFMVPRCEYAAPTLEADSWPIPVVAIAWNFSISWRNVFRRLIEERQLCDRTPLTPIEYYEDKDADQWEYEGEYEES